MNVFDVVAKLEVEMEEPQNQRDKRVEELWKKLDPAGHGELDWEGLQKGLRRLDHRKAASLESGLASIVSVVPVKLAHTMSV